MLWTIGLASPSHSVAAMPEILPLSKVKPGMEGVAWTVFQGTTPEPFTVRVMSIVRNFLPHQDVILVRATDPRVEHTGIAAGMSGSPVYIQGKLMGAIGYGFGFSKDPIAGVTPIEAMIAQRSRPGKPAVDVYSLGPQKSGEPTGLTKMALPLAVAGVSEASMRFLVEDLRGDGLVPLRAGGGGTSEKSQGDLVPGAALGVTLVRGDMSATAMGTLTFQDGNTVHAFGHPLFGAGAVSLPLVLGEVHAIIPSLATSTKLASPLREVGRLTDDLRNGILGVLGERASLVPLRIDFTSAGQALRPFSVEIARHRRLMPVFVSAALSTALTEAYPDVTDAVAEVATTVVVRGMDPITLRDSFAASDGFAPRVLAMAHGPRIIGDLLGNPFEPALIDAVNVNVALSYRAGTTEIVSVSTPGDRIEAGKPLPLRVVFRPYSGKEFVEQLTVDVPDNVAGKTVKIEVAAGSGVKPTLPKPENLKGFVDNLRVFHPARSVVATLFTGDIGVHMRGTLVPSLPGSAMEATRTTRLTRRSEPFKMALQTAFPMDRVVTGKQELVVQVLPAR